MKITIRCFALIALCANLCVPGLRAANILWVSLSPPQQGTFYGPLSGLTDQGFITLLQTAGHNVNRFHPPESQNTLLTQGQIDAMNTNDLIIIARCANSGEWQAPQGLQWNTNITKPLICMSPYLVRTLATGNRMGWFNGMNLPDDIPTVVSAVDLTSPATDYLLAGVHMMGTNTAQVYDEILDRNTSHITDPPVAGGRILLSATFQNEGNAATTNTAAVVAEFPAGTMATLGPAPLAGYRMYFAGGSREGTTAPQDIPSYTGRETLTPTGEDIFLRAVQLALSNGSPPPTDPNAPIGIISQPTSLAVTQQESLSVTFSISVTGAAPRTLQWQRDTGDGTTFTNIPDASTVFLKSSYALAGVTPDDDGAAFRVIAANSINSVTSEVAILTVTPDTAAPVPLSAASVNSTTVGLCFDDLLDMIEDTATDTFHYSVDGGANAVTAAALRPDGRSVILSLANPLGNTFSLTVSDVKNWLGTPMPTPVTLMCTNFGLTDVDVGSANPPGTNFACSAESFDVSGGGLDMDTTADDLRFVYKNTDGDFEARVRVMSLTGAERLESVAKAALTVRASTDAGSAAVNIFATPPAPGNDWISSTYRPSTGADNITNVTVSPNGMPNTWLRITREGDLFTTYHSADGNIWTASGSANLSLASSLLVGVGVVSHRNGYLATATFSDFRVGSAVVAAPTIVNSSYTAGSFSAAFQTQNGVTYAVEYKNALDSSPWTTLTMINGDGTLQTFADPGPVSPTGNRFYRVSAP